MGLLRNKIYSAALEWLQKYSIYFIFVSMLFLFAIFTQGNIIRFSNILNIITYTSPIAIIAMGVTIIIITTGIDLSSGSVLAMCAIVSAKFAQVGIEGTSNISDLPFFIPLCIGLFVGTLAGFINGWFITKTHIPPFIATLGMYTSARGLALVFSGGDSVSNLNPIYTFIGQGKVLGLPFPIIILIFMAIISYLILRHTRMGRYAYAIGGNIKAAKVSGINTDKYLIMIYSYAGLLSAVAAFITVGLINSAQPTLGMLYELDAIASSVIGGTSLSGGIGSIPGALIGALFIGVLKNGMDLMYISAYWQQIARGAVIVMAVIIDIQKHKKNHNTLLK